MLQELQGVIQFNDKLVSATDLTATYLGGPAHVEISPEVAAGRKHPDNVIHVRAQTPVPALRRAFEGSDLVSADGTLDWRGVMRVPMDYGDEPDGAARRPVTARINTSFRGAAINLPEPFAKAAADMRPLRVEVQWPGLYGAGSRDLRQ